MIVSEPNGKDTSIPRAFAVIGWKETIDVQLKSSACCI